VTDPHRALVVESDVLVAVTPHPPHPDDVPWSALDDPPPYAPNSGSISTSHRSSIGPRRSTSSLTASTSTRFTTSSPGCVRRRSE
jgi:hypothetical protein